MKSNQITSLITSISILASCFSFGSMTASAATKEEKTYVFTTTNSSAMTSTDAIRADAQFGSAWSINVASTGSQLQFCN